MSSRMRLRLDQELVARGLVRSRSQAQDLVRRGLVVRNGLIATKSAEEVDAATRLEVAWAEAAMVSRGGTKLRAALDAWGFDPSQRAALDVGASTGGFTQMLLERGARRVYAVDVGVGQLAASLREDPRVVSLEGRDARQLSRAAVPEPIGAIVVDVSFIPLRLVLPPVMMFAASNAWLVALVKPQFEVGREHVGKGGIVRDADARERAVGAVVGWLRQTGWAVATPIRSPITGGSGNIEYLVGASTGLEGAP